MVRATTLLFGLTLLCTGNAAATDRNDPQIEMCRRVLSEAGVPLGAARGEPTSSTSGHLTLGLVIGAIGCFAALGVHR
jgi:hypothetical protein